MNIEVSGNDFIIDYQFGFDFCKAIDVSKCKTKFVYLSCDGSNFLIHTVSDTLVVYGYCEAPGGKVFKLGVPAPKFVALFKRLYDGSQIKLKISKSELVVQEDNISVKLSAVNYQAPAEFPEFSYVGGDECAWLVDTISKCAAALGDGRRFNGILVDNTDSYSGRVVNFTETAFRVCAYPVKFMFGDFRMVIAIDVAKSLKSFSDSIISLMWAPGKFGAHLRSGVSFFTMLMYDDLPVRYFDSFGLLSGVPIIDTNTRKYVFSTARLSEVLEFIGSVVGAEESMVLCEVEGISSDSGNPVWKLSSTTYNACEASERIESLEPAATDMLPCRINKKSALGTLKYYDSEVQIIDKDETFLVISNKGASDVTLLLKAPV